MDLPDKSGADSTPKKVDQVVTGAVLGKRPASRRFKDFLMAESPKVLVGRIARDVLVPRAKASVEEALGAFVSGMFWGEGQQRPISGMVRGSTLRGGGINYAGISQGMSPMAMAMAASPTSSSGNYQDVVCPDLTRAETLLANMYDLLNRYNRVSVADLYEAAGIRTSPSDERFGWATLDGARISKTRDGFVLELPRPTIF